MMVSVILPRAVGEKIYRVFLVLLIGGLASCAPVGTGRSDEDYWKNRKRCGEHFFAKRYQQALDVCKRSLEISIFRNGENSQITANNMSFLADLYYHLGEDENAKKLYISSLSIKEPVLTRWDETIAAIHNNLAAIYLDEARYSEAEYHQKSCVKICKWFPCNNMALRNLANIYRIQGQYRLAANVLEEQRSVLQPNPKWNRLDDASFFVELGAVYQAQERYEEAETAFRNALGIRERALGPLHLTVARVLDGLAALYQSQGQYSQAETTYKSALKIQERPRSNTDADSAISLNGLASVYLAQGNDEQAEEFYNRALAIRERVLGKQDPTVAGVLNNLGQLYWRQGDYKKAEIFYKKALSIQESKLANAHPEIAGTLNNLALLYWAQNKYAQAEAILKRTLTIQQRSHGEQSPMVTRTLNSLASLALIREDYVSAEVLFKQVLQTQSRAFGSEHVEVAWTLTNLAQLQARQGNYDEAQKLALRALKIQEQKLGAEHLELVGSLSILADIQQIKLRHEEAERLYKRALLILDKALSMDYPAFVHLLNNLARSELAQDKQDAGIMHLLQSQQTVEQMLVQAASESRVVPLLQASRLDEELLYGLLLRPGVGSALRTGALTLSLLHKGRTMEAGSQASHAILSSLADAGQRARFERWQRLRREREELIFTSSTKQDSKKTRLRVESINQEVEDLEHDLAAASPLLQNLEPTRWRDVLALVARRLKPGSVLLEVVLGRPTQSHEGKLKAQAAHYLALLLFPDERIEVVDAGEASEVDNEAITLLRELRVPTSNPVNAAQRLYQRLVQPMEAHLRTATHLFVSAEGSLNLIPFAALHDGKRYLADRYQFHYLTSGRDLLRPATSNEAAPTLVLADPDYHRTLHPAVTERMAAEPLGMSRSIYEKLQALPRLPATRKEAETIARLLPSAQVKLDRAATERVLRQARAPRILHIATHGLFLENQLQDDVPKAGTMYSEALRSLFPLGKAVSNVSIDQELGRTTTFPLNRSLLVLADAGQGADEPNPEDDGLVSAEDVRALNLWGTQLVVLSACDTGRGTVETGQGVYGLRRAFFLAGAETTVASLWQVADAETGELMKLYYEKLIKDGQPRVGAMHQAMLEIRKQKPHPYYWAPFIVMGQDGPLRLAGK